MLLRCSSDSRKQESLIYAAQYSWDKPWNGIGMLGTWSSVECVTIKLHIFLVKYRYVILKTSFIHEYYTLDKAANEERENCNFFKIRHKFIGCKIQVQIEPGRTNVWICQSVRRRWISFKFTKIASINKCTGL